MSTNAATFSASGSAQQAWRRAHVIARASAFVLREAEQLHRQPPPSLEAAAHRLAGMVGRVAAYHGAAIRYRGEIPRAPTLLIANHVSYFDPLAILPLCPAVPFAKGEVARWPLVGAVANKAGVQFIKRDDTHHRARALRAMARILRSGVSVLNFAEGTTTDGTHLLPFWRGSFGIAQRLRVPVTPVAIRYDDDTLSWTGDQAFVPHYWNLAAQPGFGVALAFGPPLYAAPEESAEAFAARTRLAMQRLLDPTQPARERLLDHATITTLLSRARPNPSVSPPPRPSYAARASV